MPSTNTNTRLGLFKKYIGNDAKLKKDFEEIYLEDDRDWDSLQSKLEKKNSKFDKNLLGKLAFTRDLADWTGDNKALVDAFQKNPKTNSLRDIALNSNRTAFEEAVCKL